MDSTVDVSLVMDSSMMDATVDVGLMMADSDEEDEEEHRLDSVQEEAAPPVVPAQKTPDPHFVVHIFGAANLPGHYQASKPDPVIEFKITEESGKIIKGSFSSLPRQSTKNPIWDCYRDLLLDAKPGNHDETRSLLCDGDDSDEEGELMESFFALDPEETKEVREFYEENDDFVPDRNHKKELVAFYKKHNPKKLARVDEFLLKYKGQEDVMFLKLQDKYIAKLSNDEIAKKYGEDKKRSSKHKKSSSSESVASGHQASATPIPQQSASFHAGQGPLDAAISDLGISSMSSDTSVLPASPVRKGFPEGMRSKRSYVKKLNGTDKLHIVIYDSHDERHQNRIDGDHSKAWKLAETVVSIQELKDLQEKAGEGNHFAVPLTPIKPEWSVGSTVKKNAKMLQTMLLGGKTGDSQPRLSEFSSLNARTSMVSADASETDECELMMRLLTKSEEAEVQMSASTASTRRKKVYFVRHGQSTWNKAKADSDVRSLMMNSDHPLTQLGANQAIDLNNEWKQVQRKKAKRDRRNKDKAAKAVARAAKAGKVVQSMGGSTGLEPVVVEGMILGSGRSSARYEEMVDGFFEAETVLVSPLARALQTALLAMRDHTATLPPSGGFRLSRTIREFKKSVAGVDCLSDKLANASDKKVDLVECAVNELNTTLALEKKRLIEQKMKINKGMGKSDQGRAGALGERTMELMDSTMEVGLVMESTQEVGLVMDDDEGDEGVSALSKEPTEPALARESYTYDNEAVQKLIEELREQHKKAQDELSEEALEELDEKLRGLGGELCDPAASVFNLDSSGGLRINTNDASSRWWTESSKRDSDEGLLHRMDDFVYSLRYCEDDKIVVVGHSNFFFKFCQIYLGGKDNAFRKNNPGYADELTSRKLDNGACLVVELEFAANNPGCSISHAELLFDSKLKSGNPKKKKDKKRKGKKQDA
jgi:hypothetical protein